MAAHERLPEEMSKFPEISRNSASCIENLLFHLVPYGRQYFQTAIELLAADQDPYLQELGSLVQRVANDHLIPITCCIGIPQDLQTLHYLPPLLSVDGILDRPIAVATTAQNGIEDYPRIRVIVPPLLIVQAHDEWIETVGAFTHTASYIKDISMHKLDEKKSKIRADAAKAHWFWTIHNRDTEKNPMSNEQIRFMDKYPRGLTSLPQYYPVIVPQPQPFN